MKADHTITIVEIEIHVHGNSVETGAETEKKDFR